MKKLLIKILIISVGVLSLAACSSMKPSGTSAAGGAGQAASNGAMASGIGMSTEFNGIGADADKLRAPHKQTYLFDFDKYNVHDGDLPSIQAQSTYLVAHPNARVRLEGNTDERGSREYNITLGWRRAKAVAAVMEQQGVLPAQIVMLSYGKEKPVAFGHDEDSYRLNRRVDLIYEVK